jgi:hypothetical protein
MKKLAIVTTAMLAALSLHAQVTSEPKEIDPEATVKIIVNLNQLDASKEYVQNLLDSADNGSDIYMWTYNPKEHPAGHPLANGVSDPAWQNSNPALKMTKEDDRVYSYTMVPTEFYEVTPQEVYDKDIGFLVKTKNGGGFGTPDIKSDDLVLAVDPPKLVLDPAYGFPSKPQGDDIVTIYYDNARETKASMQNLNPNDCFVFAKATFSDSTEVVVSVLNQVQNNPNLQMKYVGDGTFRKFLIPNEFFGVPAGVSIETMTFLVIRRTSFVGPGDRVQNEIVFDLSCE